MSDDRKILVLALHEPSCPKEETALRKPFKKNYQYVTFTQSRIKELLDVHAECVCCGKITTHQIFPDRKGDWEKMEHPLCKRCARFNRWYAQEQKERLVGGKQ